jgi:steroid 5-alpha reductase family enzyme
VFLLQGVLAWIISLPLLAATVAPPTGLTWLDGLGVVLWLVGFVFEAGGDWQLSRFLADPANRGKVMDRGLWRYTRHPNYFGDTPSGGATSCWPWRPVRGGRARVGVMTLFIVKVSGLALTETDHVEAGQQARGLRRVRAPHQRVLPGAASRLTRPPGCPHRGPAALRGRRADVTPG